MTQEELRSLKGFLAQTPERVRQLIGNLSESEARLKPSPREFSALEQVCHLDDLEREAYGVRIEKLLGEEEPFLPDFDGSRIAQERDYNNRQLEPVLEAFTRSRAANVHTLDALAPGDFERRGTLETIGPITLATLLVKMREHDEGHLQELTALHDQLLGDRSRERFTPRSGT